MKTGTKRYTSVRQDPPCRPPKEHRPLVESPTKTRKGNSTLSLVTRRGGRWRERGKGGGGRLIVHIPTRACPADTSECCFRSPETVRTIISDGEPRTSTSSFTQLLLPPPWTLSSKSSHTRTAPELCPRPFFKCCFTPTETIRNFRDWEPRTSTSYFTQPLGSDPHPSSSVLLYVHRDHKEF